MTPGVGGSGYGETLAMTHTKLSVLVSDDTARAWFAAGGGADMYDHRLLQFGRKRDAPEQGRRDKAVELPRPETRAVRSRERDGRVERHAHAADAVERRIHVCSTQPSPPESAAAGPRGSEGGTQRVRRKRNTTGHARSVPATRICSPQTSTATVHAEVWTAEVAVKGRVCSHFCSSNARASVGQAGLA